MTIYASYGSNTNIEDMKIRCPNAKVIGKGKLNDYKLVFRGRGNATITKAEGEVVPILLWEITSKCEEELDIYEEYPKYYIKKDIKIETEDDQINAMAYIMNEEQAKKPQEPSNFYYDAIKRGYRDNNFPVEILEKSLESVKKEVKN